MDRRTFLRLGAGGLATAALGCTPLGPEDDDPYRLTARPGTPDALFPPGSHILDLDLERNPVLYVPADHDAAAPAPLAVLFHGAGGSADSWVSPYIHADRLGLLVLLMQSRGRTWDLVMGGWGADVDAVDAALNVVFQGCAVDPGAVCLGGFSDGASCALSLGLLNPELVGRLIAFSPGFRTAPARDPAPRVFVSHGARDTTLPVSTTRRIVAELRAEGCDVTYTEFDGGHAVPAEISRAAFDWLADG